MSLERHLREAIEEALQSGIPPERIKIIAAGKVWRWSPITRQWEPDK